ncbi:MAG TPA: tyrosine--tRNA ligase [Planctomycetia bacterium]|nr:tyrosine--tRNA ligase [Planctomycetia bacterium]
MDPQSFWTDLERRGFVSQTTLAKPAEWLAAQLNGSKPPRLYIGFDPTASSLHLGSLLPVIGLRRFKQAGFQPIALVGGATGMIGDPSGKTQERSLLDSARLAENVAGIGAQLERLLEGKIGEDFLLLDNADWFRPITFIDFLRDVGKHFTVNVMMAKESVRARLEDRDHGISYTEFSYMLLQAYDFLHLYETQGCQLQAGGSDQWGNITAGIDLVGRKHSGVHAQGITFPLLVTAAGAKFGKSEKGAIWLDGERTHPYFLYKYLFDVADADVVRLLKYFSFRPWEEIVELETQTAAAPQLRAAQLALALDVATLVHGPKIAAACEGIERAMHSDDERGFESHADALGLLAPPSAATEDAAELPVAHRPKSALAAEGIAIADLAVELGLFKSKGEVKREIASGGGFYVGGERVKELDQRLRAEDLADKRIVQFRKGKKNKWMVCFYDA